MEARSSDVEEGTPGGTGREAAPSSSKTSQGFGFYGRLRVTWTIVQQRPIVAVLPLVLLVAVLTAGIVVVEVQGGRERDRERVKTEAQAHSTLLLIDQYLDVALMPSYNIRDDILFNPYRNVSIGLRDKIAQWRTRLPPELVRVYIVVHHDEPVLVISPVPSEEQYLMSLKWTKDANEGGAPDASHLVELQIKSRGMTVNGFTDANLEESTAAGIAIAIPIFVPTSNPNETWGWGPDSDLCTSGRLACYDAATKTKWWGSIAVSIQLNVFFSSLFVDPNAVRNPYQLRAEQHTADLAGANTSVILHQAPGWISCKQQHVLITRVIANTQFMMDMCSPAGNPSWRAPMLALVVVLALALSVMLFWGMLLWAEHSVLLHAVLPPSAISRLKRSATLHTAAEKSQAEMNADTPAERMLMVLEGLVEGVSPPLNTLASLIATLRTRQNLYAPSDLGQRIRNVVGVDDEVAAALMAALGGRTSAPQNQEDQLLQQLHTLDGPSGTGLAEGGQFKSMKAALRYLTSPTTTGRSSVRTVHSLQGIQSMDRTAAASPSPLKLAVQQYLFHGRSADSGNGMDVALSRATSSMVPGAAGSRSKAPPIKSWSGEGQDVKQPPPSHPSSLIIASSLDDSGAVDAAGTAAVKGALTNRRAGTPHVDVSAPASHLSIPGSGVNSPDGSGEYSGTRLLATGPPPALMDELEAALLTADSYSFDAGHLAQVSADFPLSALGFWVFSRTGLITQFEISGRTLATFLRAVEGGYLANPYHNNTHAADVLQSMHVLLTTGGLAPHYADGFTHMCAYIAAIAHDYGHKGVTNDFLVATKDDLALQYNDRSPMENYHLSAVFRLMRQDANNFLAHLPDAEWARMRKLVIDLVLATDMKQHFAINGQFATVHQVPTNELLKAHKAAALEGVEGYVPTVPSLPSLNHVNSQPSLPTAIKVSSKGGGLESTPSLTKVAASRLPVPQQQQQPARGGGSPENCTDTNMYHPMPIDENERLLGLQMALKVSDLGHISAPGAVHLKWVAALEEEMFRQGDREKALGLPVSPLCDRGKTGINKAQVGFFEVVVLPLLTNLVRRFPCTRPVLEGALANYRMWYQQQQQQQHHASTAT